MSGSSPWISLSFLVTRSWSGSSQSGNVTPGTMSGRIWSVAPRQPLRDLLQQPDVAVGIREGRVAQIRAALGVGAGLLGLPGCGVPDLADLDAVTQLLLTGRDDIVDDEEQALE